MSIFEAHFRRLHARYGAGQTHELQMQGDRRHLRLFGA